MHSCTRSINWYDSLSLGIIFVFSRRSPLDERAHEKIPWKIGNREFHRKNRPRLQINWQITVMIMNQDCAAQPRADGWCAQDISIPLTVQGKDEYAQIRKWKSHAPADAAAEVTIWTGRTVVIQWQVHWFGNFGSFYFYFLVLIDKWLPIRIDRSTMSAFYSCHSNGVCCITGIWQCTVIRSSFAFTNIHSLNYNIIARRRVAIVFHVISTTKSLCLLLLHNYYSYSPYAEKHAGLFYMSRLARAIHT